MSLDNAQIAAKAFVSQTGALDALDDQLHVTKGGGKRCAHLVNRERQKAVPHSDGLLRRLVQPGILQGNRRPPGQFAHKADIGLGKHPPGRVHTQ